MTGGARIAWVTAEVWLVTLVAHAAAGGGLPSWPWVTGLGAALALATTVVLRRGASPWVVAAGVAVAQVALHVALTVTAIPGQLGAGAPGPAHHLHHSHAAAVEVVATGTSGLSLVDTLSARMVIAHVVAALLTGFVWWLRRRLGERLLRVAAPALAVRRWARLTAAAPVTRLRPRRWLVGDPGRAPPAVIAAA